MWKKYLRPFEAGECGGDLAHRVNGEAELVFDHVGIRPDPVFELHPVPVGTLCALLLKVGKFAQDLFAFGVLRAPGGVHPADGAQGVGNLLGVVGEGLFHLQGTLVGHHHHLHVGIHHLFEEAPNLSQNAVAVHRSQVFVVDEEHDIDRLDFRSRGRDRLGGRGLGGWERHGHRFVLRAPDNPRDHLFGVECEVAELPLTAILKHYEVIQNEIIDGLPTVVGDKDVNIDHSQLDLVDEGESTDDLRRVISGRRLLCRNARQNEHRRQQSQTENSLYQTTSKGNRGGGAPASANREVGIVAPDCNSETKCGLWTMQEGIGAYPVCWIAVR